MSNITVITTFPNNCWDVYAQQMLRSFIQYWPKEIPLLVALDDELLLPDVEKLLRPKVDGVVVGWAEEHAAFVRRNKDKDDPNNYRKQLVRFCHKVFAIYDAYKAAQEAKDSGAENTPRYLIWMDADVLTTRLVTMEDINKCLPKEGDAVAYLGRKDWEHSECGWLAFDLENGGARIIEDVYGQYISDTVLQQEQWHDSWIWDLYFKTGKVTNLTADKPGMEIWPQSPMAAWSIHYKGPIAKQKLHTPVNMKHPSGQNFVIQTKNSIPHEEICAHIKKNQKLIKNWVRECEFNDETVVIVSAGPHMIPEDVLKEGDKKIIAVKHALKPLKKAGIKPWASILLDPRPHVADFVKDADPDVIWFVASQVNPEVTEILLEQGCEVWGYHATVNAGENDLISKQPLAVVNGGSATATRGIFLLAHLGFKKFHLYGYELCYPDKPDMNVKDDYGQYKYMEFSVGTKNPYVEMKRNFYTEPQLMAQFEELNEIIKSEKFEIKAFGEGMVPFLVRLVEITRLRQDKIKCIMGGKLSSYKDLWNRAKEKKSLTASRKMSSKTRRKPRVKKK